MGIEDGCNNEQESNNGQENVHADGNSASDQERSKGNDRYGGRSARESQNQESPCLGPRRDGTVSRRFKVPRQCADFVLQTYESDSEILIEAEPRECRTDGHADGTDQAYTESGDGPKWPVWSCTRWGIRPRGIVEEIDAPTYCAGTHRHSIAGPARRQLVPGAVARAASVA
jgi:hypothetical protein